MTRRNVCGLRVGDVLRHVVGILPKGEKEFLGGLRNLVRGSCGDMGSSMDRASGHRCSALSGARQTTVVNRKRTDKLDKYESNK